MTGKFHILKLPHIDDVFDGFSLNTRMLESEMISRNGGVNLAFLMGGNVEVEDFYLKKFVPFFDDWHWDEKSYQKNADSIKEITDLYPSINGPCSMLVSSVDELMNHMSSLYQISHFHYILAKKHKLNGNFPFSSCIEASFNVVLSSMIEGYPNATYLYNKYFDHAYTGFPFVVENKDKKGVVVLDPTSDQICNEEDRWDVNNPRNMIFIKLGSKWEHKVMWDGEKDLYPDRICSIEFLKEMPCQIDSYKKYPKYACNAESFFERAFANPIRLDRQ